MNASARPIAFLVAAVVVVGVAWSLFRVDADHAPDPTEPVDLSAEAAPQGPPEAAPASDAPADAGEIARDEATPTTAGLRGRVVLASDASPAAGVRVVLRPRRPDFSVERMSATVGSFPSVATTTDAGGRFTLPVPAPGYLHVDHPFLFPVDTVLVSPAIHDAELRLASGGGVRGTVLGHDDSPVPSATVTLRRSVDISELTRELGRSTASAKTVSDETGAFEFRGVPAGNRWLVEVAADGFPHEAVRITVTPREVTTVDVALAAGISLSGRVHNSHGAPIPDARISIAKAFLSVMDSKNGHAGIAPIEAVTGDDGGFHARGLDAGTYNLTARADAYAPAIRKSIEVTPPSHELATPIVLQPGLVIRGVVRSETGDGIAGADVGFLRPNRIMGFSINGSVSPRDAESMGGSITTTDDDGRFVSPPLAAGAYDVIAAAEGYSKVETEAVAGTDGVVVTLSPLASIHGIVLGREEAEPVVGYRVGLVRPISFMDPDTFIPGVSKQVLSEDGTFSLLGVEPGAWRLVVIADSFATHRSVEIELAPGQASRGHIVLLDPESRIRGRVIDATDGAPIEGALVTTRSGLEMFRPDALVAQLDVRTGDDGTFTLDRLSPDDTACRCRRATMPRGRRRASRSRPTRSSTAWSFCSSGARSCRGRSPTPTGVPRRER